MKDSKQTQKNLFLNVIVLVINIAIGLFYTPYLVKSLGIVAYGIVPLSLIVNQYINVITGSLTGSLTRFYSIALQKSEFESASKYLSSSFIAITVIVLTISPFFIWLIISIDKVFNIPPQLILQTKYLFIFTLLSFLFSLYSSLLNITLYARNRLDLINILKIFRLALKVILNVIFFENIVKSITFIGIANLTAELSVFIISLIFFLRITSKKVKISTMFYEKAALFSILTMAIWVLIHQVGDTGIYRIDNILVNKFWSTRESGILGAVSELGTYVILISTVISSLFGPLILIAYSLNDHDQVKSLALQSSLIVGIFTSILVGLISGFAKPLISLWIGQEYSEYYLWLILKQISLPFYAAAGVFSFAYKAWNKVIIPATVTLIIGFINLLVSYFLCKFGHGNESIILILLTLGSIFIFLQSYILNAWIFKRIYSEVKIYDLFKIFFKILVVLIMTMFFAFGYNYVMLVENFVQLILGFIIVTSIIAILSFHLIFSAEQRRMAINYVFTYRK